MINAATDWRIIEKGKQYAIIDRCVLQKATPPRDEPIKRKIRFCHANRAAHGKCHGEPPQCC